MGWAGHIRATLALGVPLVGSNLGLMLMNTTDTVMLGWYGVEELAASVLATQFYFIVMIFGAGFSQAVMPMAAQAEGEGDERGVRRSVRMGLWMALLYSMLAMPVFWNTERILLFLGQQPRIAALAGEYMQIAMWALFPTLLSHAFRAFLSAIERTKIIFFSTLAATLLNVLVNWLLIFGNLGAPELGIQGAAYATLVVNLLMFAAMALYSARHPDAARFSLFIRFWRADWPAFADVLRLGLPVSITILAEAGMFISSSIFMGWVGVVALAAHGIAMQLASLAFMVPMGMAQAATVRVGRAYGRRDALALNRAAAATMAVSLSISAFGGLLFWLLPIPLISLFLDNSKPEAPEVVVYAVPLLLVAAAFQLFDSAQAVGAGLLRGLKDTGVPMIMALFSYWIAGLPIAYLLGFVLDLGGVGVWAGLALGLAIAAVAMNSRFVILRPVS
ncbi:MATE family efflux transporter [Oricola cellulosilytica]|uniref:Multidrug-efflux transporter n=2 Tax=Oricola cellulosilytica TaxID=1429082 RepID=A0A4R0PFX6_9HYPH|nr:MATE family efflux transporter [Oricola cellulosilytica]TCD15509.1 MATE family efflux transporter [Oricola cellulosilytica]